jgi:KipI family sensor histidine kinase inhibitor
VITVRAAGDAALLLETGPPDVPGDPAGAGTWPAGLAAAIRAADLPGVIDVVPGARTVLVSFEPASPARSELAGLLGRLPALPGQDRLSARRTEIDVVYDGPDLADVAALTRLTTDQVIARHQAADYRVGWLGFSPGFGYLTGLDPLLARVPRLDSPRVSVPAGSVAIAGGLAAVYPAASPGGWRLLGRTAAVLWDPDRDPPALLTPGSSVRFRAVGSLPPAAPEPPARSAGRSAPGAGRLVQVLQPGPLTTIQDLGRPGLAHLGVPRSGAADTASLQLANELAGNDEGAACLEVTLGRLALRFDCDAVAALAGAPAPIRLIAADDEADGEPGRPAHGTPFAVPAGTVLRFGPPGTGLRSYLAIDGGIEVPAVLGSRSADSLSGLGPAPLRPGDWLQVGRPRSRPEKRRSWRPRTGGRPLRWPADEVVLRAIAGPRDDWFGPAALDALAGGGYQVSAASNRAGLRLAGPQLRRRRAGELPSEGMAAGSLQVAHDGLPILLLADHPTTGGYPVIAVVVAADLGLAGQLRPGQLVRFRLVAE